MNLFTCKYGIENLNEGKTFYAWLDDSVANGKFEIFVDDADLMKDDEGLYVVTKLDSVKIINTP